jgi:L-tyrosine isonitrile synthase
VKNLKIKSRTINSFLADPKSGTRNSQLQSIEMFVLRAKKEGNWINFLKYWGGSDKINMDKYDYNSILMLVGFLKTIERKYDIYTNLNIIFTDTHAYLNGYDEEKYQKYFGQVRQSLNSLNFNHTIMSEILNPFAKSKGFSSTKSLIDNLIINYDLIDKNQFIQNDKFSNFKSSAAKYSQRTKNSNNNFSIKGDETAVLYLYLNSIERQIVAEQFKNFCFITYVSEEEQKLTVPNLEVAQIYSYKRGNRGRPWFKKDKNFK